MKPLRIVRLLSLGIAATSLVVATASAAPPRVPASALAGRLLTEVEYTGTWTHTYTGSPSGSSKNPGTEAIRSTLTFTESVSLFTPFASGGATLGSANSQNSPVKVSLSGHTAITYTGSNLTGCSAVFSARSGLKGDQWSVGGFGQALAYISVNERSTKGRVAVYAEAPGLRSSSHPELVVRRTGGDPTDNACDSGNMPVGEFPCNDTPLVTDPQYTPGDRGFDKPPYGFLHAVAKLDPHTPTYSRSYHVHRVLSSCDGADTVTADSRLIVNNSHATGPAPPPPAPPKAPPLPGKLRVKLAAQDDLEKLLPQAAYFCGEASLGAGAATLGLAGPGAAGIAIAGGVAFQASAPVCLPLAQAIASEIRIIKDPPLGHVDELAAVHHAAARTRTTACPHWQGQPSGFCTSLKADVIGLVASTGHVRDVVGAIATTVGRESGAVKQHDLAAAKRQDQHLVELDTQARAAVQAYLAATARFGSLFRGAGFRAAMSTAQYQRAVQALVRRLASAGIPEGTLRHVAGDLLAPRAVDVLALLAGRLVAPSGPTGASGPPTSSKPTITSVTFGGSAASPSFVIHGTNLGRRPKPNPAQHPSGVNGCPAVAGDNGYLYGTSLYVVVPAKKWSGGRYRPSLNETDCIDLVVTRFTATEVAFRLGPFYAKYHAQFSLDDGDEVQVAVNGAVRTVHVKYGATVSS